MSNAVWPLSLPQSPLIEGYGDKSPSVILRSEVDAGPAKVRRRFTAGVRPIKARLLLNKSQRDILLAFFEDTLQGGALPFDWVDPTQPQTTGLAGFESCITMAAESQFARIYATYPTPDGLMTIEFWYRAREASAAQGFAQQFGAWSIFKTDSGNITFDVWDGAASIYTHYLAMPTDGGWHHYAWAFDGVDSRLYLDGALQDTVARPNANDIATTTSRIEFGRAEIGGVKYYGDGQMDDCRIWYAKRSQSEIAAARSSELAGDETNLWGYWKFNEQSGLVVGDSTANNRDGILIGAKFLPQIRSYRFVKDGLEITPASGDILWTAALELEVLP